MTAWWAVAAGSATAVVIAGAADARERRRRDPDRVGLIWWPGVQLLAIAGVLVAVSGALHA